MITLKATKSQGFSLYRKYSTGKTCLSRVKNKTWAIKIKMHTKEINLTEALVASLGRNPGRLCKRKRW